MKSKLLSFLLAISMVIPTMQIKAEETQAELPQEMIATSTVEENATENYETAPQEIIEPTADDHEIVPLSKEIDKSQPPQLDSGVRPRMMRVKTAEIFRSHLKSHAKKYDGKDIYIDNKPMSEFTRKIVDDDFIIVDIVDPSRYVVIKRFKYSIETGDSEPEEIDYTKPPILPDTVIPQNLSQESAVEFRNVLNTLRIQYHDDDIYINEKPFSEWSNKIEDNESITVDFVDKEKYQVKARYVFTVNAGDHETEPTPPEEIDTSIPPELMDGAEVKRPINLHNREDFMRSIDTILKQHPGNYAIYIEHKPAESFNQKINDTDMFIVDLVDMDQYKVVIRYKLGVMKGDPIVFKDEIESKPTKLPQLKDDDDQFVDAKALRAKIQEIASTFDDTYNVYFGNVTLNEIPNKLLKGRYHLIVVDQVNNIVKVTPFVLVNDEEEVVEPEDSFVDHGEIELEKASDLVDVLKNLQTNLKQGQIILVNDNSVDELTKVDASKYVVEIIDETTKKPLERYTYRVQIGEDDEEYPMTEIVLGAKLCKTNGCYEKLSDNDKAIIDTILQNESVSWRKYVDIKQVDTISQDIEEAISKSYEQYRSIYYTIDFQIISSVGTYHFENPGMIFGTISVAKKLPNEYLEYIKQTGEFDLVSKKNEKPIRMSNSNIRNFKKYIKFNTNHTGEFAVVYALPQTVQVIEKTCNDEEHISQYLHFLEHEINENELVFVDGIPVTLYSSGFETKDEFMVDIKAADGFNEYTLLKKRIHITKTNAFDAKELPKVDQDTIKEELELTTNKAFRYISLLLQEAHSYEDGRRIFVNGILETLAEFEMGNEEIKDKEVLVVSVVSYDTNKVLKEITIHVTDLKLDPFIELADKFAKTSESKQLMKEDSKTLQRILANSYGSWDYEVVVINKQDNTKLMRDYVTKYYKDDLARYYDATFYYVNTTQDGKTKYVFHEPKYLTGEIEVAFGLDESFLKEMKNDNVELVLLRDHNNKIFETKVDQKNIVGDKLVVNLGEFSDFAIILKKNNKQTTDNDNGTVKPTKPNKPGKHSETSVVHQTKSKNTNVTTAVYATPKTSDDLNVYLFVALLLVSTAIMIVTGVKLHKSK